MLRTWSLGLCLALACGACDGAAARHGTVAAPDVVAAQDAAKPLDGVTFLGADPSTTCAGASGAWQAIYDTAPFVDVAWAPDGRVAVLQATGIRFYTTDGHPAGDALDLSAEATQLRAIVPVATGGWLLRDDPWFGSGGWQPAQRILRMGADAKTLWRVEPDATFVPVSATPLADGGAWVAGAAGAVGALRRLDAAGQTVQTLAWPEVVLAHDVVARADGSVCAAGESKTALEYVGPPEHADQLVLRCWSPAGVPFWTWQQPASWMGMSARLDAWPDGRLFAHVRSADYPGHREVIFAIDPPDAVTTTFTTALFTCCSNQNYGSGDGLIAAQPIASGGLAVLRQISSYGGASHGKIYSEAALEWYLPSGQPAGSATLNTYVNDWTRQFEAGIWTVAHAALRLPDGSTLVVGEAPHDRYSEEPGKGWMYRLPALSCP